MPEPDFTPDFSQPQFVTEPEPIVIPPFTSSTNEPEEENEALVKSAKIEEENKTVEMNKAEIDEMKDKVRVALAENKIDEDKVKRLSGPYNESKLIRIEAILKNTSIDSQQLRKAIDQISHIL